MEATVILAKCKQGQIYGIRVQKMEDNDWWRTWSFPIKELQAAREGYDTTNIHGNLYATPEYPGCPYCESKTFVRCDCGKITCWGGELFMSCSWCGKSGTVADATDKMSFDGNAL